MPTSSPATAVADAVRQKRSHASEHARRTLDAIRSRNSALRAFRAIDGATALREAKAVEERVLRGDDLPLAGVPVAIKDNVAQAGLPNRAGRPDGTGTPASHDAEVVTRLRAAGAVIIGRTNMDELAYGVTGSNPHTGQVRNPRKESHHPGGSSAGSGAAVGAGLVPLAIGTDTAGSVRIPASLCGVVGMRPTYGLVPTGGVAPLCPTLDTVGPLARSVSDVALLLSVLAQDPSLATAPTMLVEAVRTMRVASIERGFAVDLDACVRESFGAACALLARLVGELKSIDIPELSGGGRASGPIIGAEASFAWQKELEEHADWFGEEVSGHLVKGAGIKAVRYLRALNDARDVARAIDAALEHYDALVLPTTATLSTNVASMGNQLQFLALTVPFSLGGYPAITVPMGASEDLPMGLQLVGRRNEDARLLGLAAAFERSNTR